MLSQIWILVLSLIMAYLMMHGIARAGFQVILLRAKREYLVIIRIIRIMREVPWSSG